MKSLGDEGYLIVSAKYKRRRITAIAANTDIGVLYGTFHFSETSSNKQKH
ncbi:MAG: hypothetical protein MZV64_05360 [Ignavibacteriales bacterium]|nr:hypothetical protein [Ignavibacteriales bacterium]